MGAELHLSFRLPLAVFDHGQLKTINIFSFYVYRVVKLLRAEGTNSDKDLLININLDSCAN